MKQDLKEELRIPENTTMTLDNRIFTIKGPKGEVKKRFYNPKITARIIGNSVVFESKKATKREKKLIKTYIAHLKSMIKGANEMHVYKLKICSGHFPMTASVKGNLFELKNFYGETVPRTTALPEGVNVKVDGQYILIEGADKAAASKAASLIELLTRRPGFDKRIFQDGIFIVEKDGEPLRG
ncbi:MAG TPA: 50S ribosomal protein L6 [Candidatus Nanoarchaeia archaeon]|nr:50S ribosomal protein L6 [Candidatus Nanoarchaeia archaeon]